VLPQNRVSPLPLVCQQTHCERELWLYPILPEAVYAHFQLRCENAKQCFAIVVVQMNSIPEDLGKKDFIRKISIFDDLSQLINQQF